MNSSNHTRLIHCLALQNISAHSIGENSIGPTRVEVIFDTFVAFIDDDAVVSAALSALLNLCVGFTFINTFLENEYLEAKYRLIIYKIIHNMSCGSFSNRNDFGCVIMKLLTYAEYDTELYLAMLRFLKTLLQEMNNNKLEFMIDLLEQNFVQMLNVTLQYDYAIYKKLVMNLYDYIIII